MKTIRQGDVVLVKRWPWAVWRARPRRERVFRFVGETGHAHELRGARLFERDGKPLARVERGTKAVLDHPEHGAVTVPEGVWEIHQARSHAPQLQTVPSATAPTRRQSPRTPRSRSVSYVD